MSKALIRRAKFREDLIHAAERAIASGGLGALKTRELAREIGVANGAVYNLVEDVDELILRVGSRTLARLDAALTSAESAGAALPRETLVRIAVAYCDFAAENLELWRALFEHRMAPGKPVPIENTSGSSSFARIGSCARRPMNTCRPAATSA